MNNFKIIITLVIISNIAMLGTFYKHYYAQKDSINNRLDTDLRKMKESISTQTIRLMKNVEFLSSLLSKVDSTEYKFILQSFLEKHPNYFQARIINISGKEEVKVERFQDIISIYREEQLQNKADRSYFKRIRHTPLNNVFISEINLNKEKNKIDPRIIPTIRTAKFLINNSKSNNSSRMKERFLILNYNLEFLLGSLTNHISYDLFLTKHNGFFVFISSEKTKKEKYSSYQGALNIKYYLPEALNRFPKPKIIQKNNDLFLVKDIDPYSIGTKSKSQFHTNNKYLKIILRANKSLFNSKAILTVYILFFLSFNFLLFVISRYVLKLYSQNQLELTKFKTIFNMSPSSIIIIDYHGSIIDFNTTTNKMFGYNRNELIGNNINILMPPPFSSEHDSYLKKFRERGFLQLFDGKIREVLAMKKDKSTFPILLDIQLISVSNKKMLIGVIQDISAEMEFNDKELFKKG